MTKLLKVLLADAYALYLKTQNYHWNVEGSEFFILHDVFEKQYKHLQDVVDDVAELIRMHGEKVDANFLSFDKLKTIEDANMHHDAKSMLKDLHQDYVTLNKLSHQILLEVGDDEGVASLMSDLISWYEKQIWMLAASLK